LGRYRRYRCDAFWLIRTLLYSSPRSRLSSTGGSWPEVRQVHRLGYSLLFSAGCCRDARSDQWLCSRISVQPKSQDFSSVRRW